jgi:hypothetical protein
MPTNVKLETGVYIASVGQLEEQFAVSSHDSVFEFLREFIGRVSRPLLVTGDDGLQMKGPPCQKA